MLDCISVANMRDSDAYTIAHFVPSLTLPLFYHKNKDL